MFTFMKSEKGVTLIELISSIAILSIILVSFMYFFINSAQYNGVSADKMHAANIAREVHKDFKEDPDKNLALKNLIAYSRTSAATTISKSSYPDLHLTQDIQDNSGLLTLTTTKQLFTVVITVDTTSDPNVDLSLSKLHVQVKKDAKLVSETYTYFEN
ncbi:prepilin-type N-terminal cleavage/methylation domain-containing protein [Metabacillus indicus]|uniref:prepilin-type N-terminal cleavage/methylation domain-containing protein n=1 Tax=Metabacillus indicus TaxID=246786 RepID=UPI002A072F66|nr:prepilin-type N-terminal cleavage/methylation domain-containing protein [Metabacillus indicus]MDX8289849.1 prepilin-type N-terminal cleavage/methylation domain-containing protein [Metabacillus indicus]